MKNFIIHLDGNRKIGPLSEDELIEFLEAKSFEPNAICEYLITGEKKTVAEFIEIRQMLSIDKGKDKTSIIDIIKDKDEKGVNDFEEFRPESSETASSYTEIQFTKVEDEINQFSDSKEENIQESKNNLSDEGSENKDPPVSESSAEENSEISLDENRTILFDSHALVNSENIKKEELLASAEENKYFNPLEQKRKVKSKKKISIKKKKGMSKIVAFAFFVVILMLFMDDDETVEINPIIPNISYPTKSEYIDEEKSVEFFQEGQKLLKMYSYQSKLSAARAFKKAYEFNPNNEVLAKLVHVYAELLPHYSDSVIGTINTENKSQVNAEVNGLNTIFQILTTLEKISLNNFDVTMGKVLFLKKLKKYKAAIVTLLKYQVAGGKVEAIYYFELLDLLRLERRNDLAAKVYSMLQKLKITGVATTSIISKYLIDINKIDEAKQLLEINTKSYPDSVELWLEYANVLLFYGEVDKLKTVLSILKELVLDQSPLYYAEYLKYMGMYFAFNKDNKKAVELFTLSLKYKEDIKLRTKLSQLANSSGNNKTASKINDLINESKVIEFVEKSKESKKIGDYEKATLYAIEAVDLETSSVEAKLNLAEIQTEKGFYAEALDVLTELHKSNPGQKVIVFALIKMYIDSYKFLDANRVMESNSKLEKENNPTFLFLKAYMYFKSNDPYRAHLHFKKAVKFDPFNDKVHYYYALNFMKFGQYQNALKYINNAIDIDPENVEYRLLYAEIMYFMKGVDFAIGYLNGILRDINYFDSDTSEKTEDSDKLRVQDIMKEVLKIRTDEVSSVLAQVAIYYYKSGQIDLFEKYKKILEDKFNGTRVFYEFLIKQSKIDDRTKQIYEYTKKLLAIEPGNLKVRMEFAEFLLSENKLDEALTELFVIKDRLDTYPKVLFLISRIYLMKGDLEKSLEVAKLEIQKNSNLEFGYLLMGDIYLKKNEINNARESYKNAQARNARSSDALMGLGDISFLENQLDRALDLYVRASKEAPSVAIIWKKLGDTYKQLGQRNLAVSSYETYLSLKPDAEDKEQVSASIQYLKQF